ncbi:MAG: site-specific DNA-methyltransferase [Candidatus Rokubacteria bacterium]|nr:site-specific DNA-methyltransferase [Candidatus Rokubacteria bacterium]
MTITPAKGRPMLTWVGKRPLRHVVAFPAQQVEVFDPIGDAAKRPGGLLLHGDNKEVLAYLLANGYRGKVDLVYIDPPFDSGADYVRKITLRGPKGTAKLDGEAYTLGEQLQYTDIWANDNYLQFMYERLLLLKELLSIDGALYLHLDLNRSYMLRLLLDEVLGRDHFRNEIVWQRTTAHSDTRGRFGEVHDTLLCYAKGDTPRWNELHTPYSDEYRDSKYTLVDSETGRRYRLGDLTAPGPRPNLEYEWHGIKPPPGRCWAVTRDRMDEHERTGRIVFSKTGMPQYKRYLDEMKGVPLQDVWTDIPPVNPMAEEKLDYPTQKPEVLLERIICASSHPGDVVLDCFVGSGTTAAVAQELGRRWIACDINKGAIQTTSKRLQGIIGEQIAQARRPRQEAFQEAERAVDAAEPAQLSFSVFRVNDYDLAIQHQEAVNLACEHIGVTPMRTDPYFDGTLGKRLVKIVPFNHPLTLLDLEEVKRELQVRPGEDRDVVMVCLGKEPAADAEIENWNRLRRSRASINRIDVIELRTDPKYGKFFQHQPAQTRVSVDRGRDTVLVAINQFISPSIVERLQSQSGIVQPKIEDWRAMADCVLIDPDYDGAVFRIGVSDVPEKKSDFVAGRYELPADRCGDAIAVKIVDMLGEEVLIVDRRPNTRRTP